MAIILRYDMYTKQIIPLVLNEDSYKLKVELYVRDPLQRQTSRMRQ